MGLDLSDVELAAAAAACRALAFQEELRARAIGNAALRAAVIDSAERYAALAFKIEAARRARPARLELPDPAAAGRYS
jgi:hypothetical protein